MHIILTDRFQRDLKSIPTDTLGTVLEMLLRLPSALIDLHRHAGLGVRKIHQSGIFEARVGLKLRIIIGVREGSMSIERLGTHDEVQRYLKSL